MDVSPLLTFITKEDEIQYWMDVAHQMYQSKEDAVNELQEYQMHSQLLEKELEASFDQSDKSNRLLREMNYKLTVDNEDLKQRFDEKIQMYSTLQFEVQNLKLYNEELLDSIRKLEQKNDDLERLNREKIVTEEKLESQFNMTLEKLAFLETEVDEIDNLKCIIQRLQEENTDLKQQIERQQKNCNVQENVEKPYSNSNYLEFQNIQMNTTNDIEMDKEIEEGYKAMPLDILKYVRELEYSLECSRKAHRATKASEEKLQNRLNSIIKKIALLEEELRNKQSFSTHTIQRPNSDTRDLSQDVQVRLRRQKDKNIDRTSRCRSDTSKHSDENQRNSFSNRLNRHIENRVKKVKEEESRQQNLAWFLKRWRHTQINWLRKRE